MLDQRFEATVAGVTFTGRTFDWTPGFYVKTVEGLMGGGEVSYESVPAPDGQGEFDLPNRRTDPRIITLTGFAQASSMSELGRMTRRLDGLLAQRDASAPFSWTEFGEGFSTTVRRGRGCLVGRAGSTGRARFTMRFRARSQVYFGKESSWPVGSTPLILRHSGNYPAAPVITVRGPHSGFTITGPGGRVFSVAQSAGVGRVHRVEMATGAVYLDGSRQYGVTPRANAWAVPPGQDVTVSCTAPFSAVLPDTFI